MRLFGQTFTTSIIERAAAAEPGVTRSALSRRVCNWLDWCGPTGKPQEVSSRKALMELQRQGLLTLPAAQRAPPQERAADEPAPFEAPGFAGPLEALGAVELVAVEERTHAALYRAMMARYHPLGGGPLCGAQQRYLIRSPVLGWLGALAFSAAAWQVAARDEWIGWGAHARRANLARVVANSRFLILPTLTVPNLGSHVLGLAAARVRADWPARYGYAPLLLETFVAEHHVAGTVYKAANWLRVGESAGRGRQDRANCRSAAVKALYVLPLQRDWRAQLCERPTPPLRLAPPAEPTACWAEQEFGWYSAHWNIEVFHRALKSGCRIEDRRLGDAASLEACLAIDLVVAWRVMHLTKRGRETPDIPCSVFFEEAEWKALICHQQRSPTPPETPPTLGEAMHLVAKLGGFLGRKGDGHPGATVLWRGLNRLADITETFTIFHPSIPSGP
jgi:hypothetical protein